MNIFQSLVGFPVLTWESNNCCILSVYYGPATHYAQCLTCTICITFKPRLWNSYYYIVYYTAIVSPILTIKRLKNLKGLDQIYNLPSGKARIETQPFGAPSWGLAVVEGWECLLYWLTNWEAGCFFSERNSRLLPETSVCAMSLLDVSHNPNQ